MKQPRIKIARTIADATLKNGGSKQYAKEVAAYLLAENRVSELDSIMRDIQADWAEAGNVEVIARSAHELTPALRTQISNEVKRVYPTAKQINIEAVLDPSIIGGVRIELPGKQLDLSIEAKLNKFKQLTLAGKD